MFGPFIVQCSAIQLQSPCAVFFPYPDPRCFNTTAMICGFSVPQPTWGNKAAAADKETR